MSPINYKQNSYISAFYIENFTIILFEIMFINYLYLILIYKNLFLLNLNKLIFIKNYKFLEKNQDLYWFFQFAYMDYFLVLEMDFKI